MNSEPYKQLKKPTLAKINVHRSVARSDITCQPIILLPFPRGHSSTVE